MAHRVHSDLGDKFAICVVMYDPIGLNKYIDLPCTCYDISCLSTVNKVSFDIKAYCGLNTSNKLHYVLILQQMSLCDLIINGQG